MQMAKVTSTSLQYCVYVINKTSQSTAPRKQAQVKSHEVLFTVAAAE